MFNAHVCIFILPSSEEKSIGHDSM